MAAPGQSPQPNRGHPAHPPGWAMCAEEEQDTPRTRVPLGRAIWPLCHLLLRNRTMSYKGPKGFLGLELQQEL